jgi:prepilin-type processing-associated H-X9-DG protein
MATPGSEFVVTKLLDRNSPLLLDEEDAGSFSAYDGDSQTAGAHPGGVNVCLCDGSVRSLNDGVTPNYNPYVTVDFLV